MLQHIVIKGLLEKQREWGILKMNEKDVEKVINSLIDRIYPKGMKTRELKELAKSAKLSPETIRQMRRRKSLTTQTLIRLLMAIGVKSNDITNLPQNGRSGLSNEHTEWNKLGTSLSTAEVKEFTSFIKYVRKHWQMK